VPQPEIFISPPAGPAGQEVTLQGFEFQPDLDVFVQLGDSTISTLRTDDDGGFTARLFMPITSEGSQTISVFDESGNGASTSYFTEYGIGNIRDSIEDLTERLDDLDTGAGGSASDDGSTEPAPDASPAADASPAVAEGSPTPDESATPEASPSAPSAPPQEPEPEEEPAPDEPAPDEPAPDAPGEGGDGS
jgi:hypothetical protein